MFKRGDICICTYKLRSNKLGITKSDCKVRIVSSKKLMFSSKVIYSVYNLDFKRYEQVSDFYLKLDKYQNRINNINKLLN
jgi:hypothetical protein